MKRKIKITITADDDAKGISEAIREMMGMKGYMLRGEYHGAAAGVTAAITLEFDKQQ